MDGVEDVRGCDASVLHRDSCRRVDCVIDVPTVADYPGIIGTCAVDGVRATSGEDASGNSCPRLCRVEDVGDWRPVQGIIIIGYDYEVGPYTCRTRRVLIGAQR